MLGWLKGLFGGCSNSNETNKDRVKAWQMEILSAENGLGKTVYYVRFNYPSLGWVWLRGSNFTDDLDYADRFTNLEEAKSKGELEIAQIKEWYLEREVKNLRVVE